MERVFLVSSSIFQRYVNLQVSNSVFPKEIENSGGGSRRCKCSIPISIDS